jgi:phage tail-like protein
MANGDRTDPFLGFRFRVEVDSVIQAGFSECSGLQAETEVEEVREGGLNDYVHKLPKGSKHVNLTLKRGLTDSDVLWNWYQDVMSGKKGQRKMVHVVLQDITGQEVWRWSFREAYPVKWTGPDLKADGSAVAIETLELAHHGFDVKVTKR